MHFRCECVPHERLGAEKEVGNNTQVSSGKKEEEEEDSKEKKEEREKIINIIKEKGSSENHIKRRSQVCSMQLVDAKICLEDAVNNISRREIYRATI